MSAAEYIILLALICLVGFIIWRLFGGHARDSTRNADGVVNGLATTTTADGEAGHGAPHAEGEAPATTAGGDPHGGHGDIRRARRLSVNGTEQEFGEDEEVRRSRTRSRNSRWIAIGVLTAGVLAIVLGKKRS